MSEDAELVRRARAGDPAAFGELVRRYMRPAYAVALSVTGRHEQAEDAAQEAFVAALERLESCRHPARFGAWLLTIVRNRARNLVRREALRSGDPVPASLRARGPTPAEAAEAADMSAHVREGLARLSDLQREIVLLHDLEGWKHREIAERLGMPAGTVRSHLHFARRSLRDFLEGRVRPESRNEE